jgi:RNA polymerase sigma-B factor
MPRCAPAGAKLAVERWLSERTPENRSRLVTAHAYLCARATRKFLRPGLERCDLEQVAAIGLLKACDRYDQAMGTPFEAYAWLFVIGELMHYVRDWERPIRPPRKLRALETRVRRAGEELAGVLGRKPTQDELAQHLGIGRAQLLAALECRARATADSLDSLAPSAQLAIDAEAAIDLSLDRLLIERALTALNTAERAVLFGVYTAGYSQLEIARRLGYSQRHISRVRRTALGKLAPLCAER